MHRKNCATSSFFWITLTTRRRKADVRGWRIEDGLESVSVIQINVILFTLTS
jgi:hypothetical protein